MARTIAFDEEQILDRAVDLFWSKGYHDASAQDLVDRLGLNRSSIYNTFGGKHELFLRVLKRYRDRESAGLLNFIDTASPTVASIEALLNRVVQASKADMSRPGCLIVNTAVELGAKQRDVLDVLQENASDVIAALEKFIRKGQRTGSINATLTPRGLSLVLFHTITALRVTTKVMHDPAYFDGYINAQLKLFKP